MKGTDAAPGGVSGESRRALVRSHRILFTALGLTVAALALVGCAGTSGPGAASSDVPSDPDLGAAWLDDGRMIGLVTLGSSTCIPTVDEEPEFTGGTLHVTFADPKADEACTADLVPRATLVDLPEGIDPEQDLDIEVIGEEYYGEVVLQGVTGLDPDGETDYQPSAGWATADGQFVILTWGSSTCLPMMEDVAATGPAEVTVTYATPPADEVCTLDMVPRGAVAWVNDLEQTVDIELVLTGGEFADVRLPIYGNN